MDSENFPFSSAVLRFLESVSLVSLIASMPLSGGVVIQYAGPHSQYYIIASHQIRSNGEKSPVKGSLRGSHRGSLDNTSIPPP